MDFMSLLGIAFYYLFFLVGSVTVGYFVLRVSYPEVRTYDANRKLVVSGMLGLVVVFLSYITNIFFFGVDRFLNLDSYVEIFTILYSVVFFVVFRYYYSFTPKFITIAIPVRTGEPKVQVKEEKRSVAEKRPSLDELKKEVAGREVEINIPLKTEEFKREGVEGLKREVLGEASKSIEVPLKQDIEIPLKQESSSKFSPRFKDELPVKKEEKPVVKKEEKPLTAKKEAKEIISQPVVQKKQVGQPQKEPQKEELQKSEFKFQKEEKPQKIEEVKQGGFKFQKKEEKPKTPDEAEIEGILKDVVKETVEEAQGKVIPKHRRYLLTPEQKEKVKVIASSDMAGKEEFQALVQDVYEELRKTKTEGEVQKITPNVPAEPVVKKEEKPVVKKEEKREKRREKEEKPVEALSLSDVLGAEGGEKKEEKPSGLFAQLSGITEGVETGGKVKESSSEFVKVESESGMGCPNCHAKNTRIVFCPYCGGAMCTNCSPQIKIEGDKFIFTCPHCGEEVSVKKKKS